MIDLKRCPHCGSKAKLHVGTSGVRVICINENCRCQTAAYSDKRGIWTDAYPSREAIQAVESAIRTWVKKKLTVMEAGEYCGRSICFNRPTSRW